MERLLEAWRIETFIILSPNKRDYRLGPFTWETKPDFQNEVYEGFSRK